jgi:hypothetical protein
MQVALRAALSPDNPLFNTYASTWIQDNIYEGWSTKKRPPLYSLYLKKDQAENWGTSIVLTDVYVCQKLSGYVAFYVCYDETRPLTKI